MGFKIFSVNEYLTDADVNAYLCQQLIAIKTADESVTSSITLQDDNQLFVTVQPNTSYWFEAFLVTNGAVGADINIALFVPSGTIRYTTNGLDFAATGVVGDVNRRSLGGGAVVGSVAGTIAAATSTIIPPAGIVRVGASGGTFKLQWAQNVSTATATRVMAGSYMRLLRVRT